MMDKHLWEYDHPYYCNRENYYSNDCNHTYNSWEAFLDEMGNSDMDYNLLFRWDWTRDIEKGSVLQLFFVQQRLGRFVVIEVVVERTDEDSIKAFLQARWAHLTELWMPFGGGNNGS